MNSLATAQNTMAWYYAVVNDPIFGNGPSLVRYGVDNQFDHAAYMDEQVGKLSGGLSWHKTIEEAQAAIDALKEQGNGPTATG